MECEDLRMAFVEKHGPASLLGSDAVTAHIRVIMYPPGVPNVSVRTAGDTTGVTLAGEACCWILGFDIVRVEIFELPVQLQHRKMADRARVHGLTFTVTPPTPSMRSALLKPTMLPELSMNAAS